MGSCLSAYGPSTMESHLDDNYSVSICSMQGTRKKMQDSYCIHLSLSNHPSYSIFGVFDGFNGCAASQYLKNHLVKRLNTLNDLNNDKIIIDEINEMDQEFLKLKTENIFSGSTVVFALICSSPNSSNTPNTPITPSSHSFESVDMPITEAYEPIHSFIEDNKKYQVRIFWIGDSRALLIRHDNNNNFEQLTIDHHCSLEAEMKRIYNPLTNGTIINNKIDGITELSRSFGCYSMKNNQNLRDDEQKQICIAECKHVLCKSNERLLLFSDGLTEKWSNKELIKNYNFHWNQHKNYSNPMQNSLNYLCEQCMDHGSSDNITAISIKFK